MIIQNVTLFNWQGYLGKHDFNFRGTGGRNSSFIYADNTVGKSAFWEAIRFALYGRVERRRIGTAKPFVAQHSGDYPLMNTTLFGKKGAKFYVELIFSHENNRYRLYRGYKPKFDNKPVKLSSDLKIDLLLENLDDQGNDRFEKDPNRWIEQHILPARLVKFFMFDGERLEEYEDLMRKDEDIDLRDDIESIIRSPILREGHTALKKAYSHFGMLAGKEKTMANKNEEHRRLWAKRDKELKQIEKSLEDISTEIKGYKKSIAEIDEWLQVNEASKDTALVIKTTQENIGQLEKSIDGFRADISHEMQGVWKVLISEQISQSLKKIKDEKKAQDSHLKKMGALEEEIKKIREALDGSICSACDRPRDPLNEKQKEEKKLEITSLEAKYSEHESKSKFPTTEEHYLRLSALEKMKTDQKDLSRLFEKEKLLLDNLANLKRAERDNKTAREAISEERNEEVREQLSQKEILESKMIEARVDEKRFLQDRDDLVESMKELEIGDDSDNQSLKLRRLSKSVEITNALSDIFNSALTEFRENVRQNVEQRASETFLKISNNRENYQGLEITEDYTVSIIDLDGLRNAGSQAQSLVMAYSIIDALSACSGFEFPMIVDTPARSLASKNAGAVYDYFMKSDRQVIFLPTDTELNPDTGDDKFGKSVAATYELSKIKDDASTVGIRVNNLE
tara:strand:+ start:52 stop:2097 length:2046 start_codon:yes stop_codon:yes gene_type:complete